MSKFLLTSLILTKSRKSWSNRSCIQVRSHVLRKINNFILRNINKRWNSSDANFIPWLSMKDRRKKRTTEAKGSKNEVGEGVQMNDRIFLRHDSLGRSKHLGTTLAPCTVRGGSLKQLTSLHSRPTTHGHERSMPVHLALYCSIITPACWRTWRVT